MRHNTVKSAYFGSLFIAEIDLYIYHFVVRSRRMLIKIKFVPNKNPCELNIVGILRRYTMDGGNDLFSYIFSIGGATSNYTKLKKLSIYPAISSVVISLGSAY